MTQMTALMKILVDHREPERITRMLRECQVEYEVEQLPIGDILIAKDRAAVVIERKTIADFIASLRNNRLWEQLHRFLSTDEISGHQIKRWLLVLDGKFEEYIEECYGDRKMWASIMGALLEITFVYNTPVIVAENDDALQAFLRILIKRELDGKNEAAPKARWFRRGVESLPEKDHRLLALTAIPLIGEVMAQNLLAHFGSIEKIATASNEELQAVEGIGEVRAARIYELFH